MVLRENNFSLCRNIIFYFVGVTSAKQSESELPKNLFTVEPRIKDTLGQRVLSFIERLPLFGG